MLVDPSLDDLLERVDNKFKLVTLALKRARQINDGHPLLVDSGAVKPVSLALREIYNGSVIVKEMPDEEEEAPTLDEALRMVEADEAIETIEHEEEAQIEAAARDLALAVEESPDEDQE